jgi:hypothetical protein
MKPIEKASYLTAVCVTATSVGILICDNSRLRLISG